MLLIVTSCSSLKKVTKQKEIPEESFFFKNAVYTELLDNNYVNLYYFNSENNMVYISKIKKQVNDSINQKKEIQLTTSLYGRYIINGHVIKMQKDIDKIVKIKPKRIFSIMFMFIPVRLSKETTNIKMVDKEIITEGEVKADTITLTKSYFGTKKLNFEKEPSSKINLMKSCLIHKPDFKGVAIKNDALNSYSVLILYKNDNNVKNK